jgi:hypothetical protein
MKMLSLVLAVAAVAAVTLVGSASAGGWATVGLSSTPPAGLGPEDPWKVDITVLQHGTTPLAGVTPVVRIRDDGGKVVDTFPAAPTERAGVYRADVRFPGEGTYSYEVYDGFTTYGGARTHTFKPVAIGPGDGGLPYGWLALALGVGLASAAATVLWLRRRTPDVAPVHLKEAA